LEKGKVGFNIRGEMNKIQTSFKGEIHKSEIFSNIFHIRGE
jgi:hypothetical protein